MTPHLIAVGFPNVEVLIFSGVMEQLLDTLKLDNIYAEACSNIPSLPTYTTCERGTEHGIRL